MKILVVDNAEPEDRAFNIPLLKSLSVFATVESVGYRHILFEDQLATRYDGIVISGAPIWYGMDIIDSRPSYLLWIKTIDIPVLGICLGHQVIGRIYGSRLIVNKETENEIEPLRIAKVDPLFRGIASGETVAATHKASVTLPANFELLASTPRCHNEAMKHTEKAIYGVQFHPEHSTIGSTLLDNFVAILNHR